MRVDLDDAVLEPVQARFAPRPFLGVVGAAVVVGGGTPEVEPRAVQHEAAELGQ